LCDRNTASERIRVRACSALSVVLEYRDSKFIAALRDMRRKVRHLAAGVADQEGDREKVSD